jgi:hypothetical protein
MRPSAHLSDVLRHYRCSVVRFERCAARTGSSGIGQSTTKCARPAVVIERGQDCCFARRSAHSAALATGKGGECAVGAWGCDWRCEGSHAREIRHYPVECGRVLSQLGLGVPAPLDRPELELDRTSFGPGAWPESLQLKCICQLKREGSRVASARPVPISRHACCAPWPRPGSSTPPKYAQSRAERCSFVPFREPNRSRCGVSIPCRSNLRCGKRFVLQQTRRHWQLEPKHGAASGATARMRTFSDRTSGSERIPANALHSLWPAPLMRQVYVKPIAEMQEATCFDAHFTLPLHVPRSFPVSGGSFRLNMHDGAREDCLAALRSRDAPQSHSAC